MIVFVLASNARVHLLPAFAYLFNKYWSPDQTVTVHCYDVSPPPLPSNFTVQSLGEQDNRPWSDGARQMVEGAPDQFILMLEDYFLRRQVLPRRIRALWTYAAERAEVAKLDLSADRVKVPYAPHVVVAGMPVVRSLDDAPYQASLQAAIWKREFLWSLLTENEDPWTFEKHATNRIIGMRRVGWGGLILGTAEPVLDYVNAAAGQGELKYNVPTNMLANLKQEGLWEA